MPRRFILAPSERSGLLAIPTDETELIRLYTLSEQDLSAVRQRRGDTNRLGFAVLLCYLRYPGYALAAGEDPPHTFLAMISAQLGVEAKIWEEYAGRQDTRREHLSELRTLLGLTAFGLKEFRHFVRRLTDLALQTDKGVVLAASLIQQVRKERVVLPPVAVLERICAQAITRANRIIFSSLTKCLDDHRRALLDNLLSQRVDANATKLAWLRQPPGISNAKHLLEHINRLEAIKALDLSESGPCQVHQNRLLKLAREGSQMTAQHLRDLEAERRYATLVAVMMETKATIIDQIVDLHDRMIGGLFNRAKRVHEEQFQQSARAINEKVRLYWRIGEALLDARRNGSDPFHAIEILIPWDTFAQSVTEAQKLSQAEDFDFLHRIVDGYSQIRRYAPAFLEALHFDAAPAAREIAAAVEAIKTLYADNARKVPGDAPVGFVRKRWQDLVFTDGGLDRRFYELCALAELKNALRSGDVWVQGSRQFRDFDEYLIRIEEFKALLQQTGLGLAITTECEQYLGERLLLLQQQLENVDRIAQADELPDAIITTSGLKITPLVNAVPDEADILTQRAYALLPHVKITELLLEVDDWTGFTGHFTHLKSGDTAKERILLLAAILADAINLGLAKMAESCPGSTYARLSWLQAWHIRDETYSAALAELVNAQFKQPFAAYWGEGTTSSSDGQRFRAGGRGEASGQINARYGSEPGVLFYTHLSDQYAPFHTQVINATVRDATYVLDGLLYHESDLRIEEHYTDTAGFTDHVFALMHLLGYRFAPRIRDLADRRLYVPDSRKEYPALSGLIGGVLNQKCIRSHWDEILRLATSIQKGTVTASLMLRKLGSYPRQNGLAVALRELGRIERTLFTLDWLQNTELRRRVHVGLNKGEAKNALAKAVFFNRLGEIRDRSFENQRYRASGLNSVVAAIILWNTVYLERATRCLKEHGLTSDDNLLQHLSPLGWEHINLTGDYVWRQNKRVEQSKFRPLRPLAVP
jgi:TnpA family transposase